MVFEKINKTGGVKMQKRKIVLMVMALVFLIAGCASSLRTYVSARTILNNYWEAYLDYRDAMPDGEAKDALKAKFGDIGKDSYFTKAKKALDAWDAVLGSPDQATQAQVYYAIWNQIIALMLSENIVVIK